MASRAGSRLVSNSYAHQADRSAAPSNVQAQQHQQAAQQASTRRSRFLHGSMARRAPGTSSNLSFAAHATSSSSAAVAGSSTSIPANPATTSGLLPRPPSASASSSFSAVAESDPDGDIIVRDERGDYRLDMPAVTPLPRDEARDEREMESRLIETFRTHHQQIEPAELRRTLQASLAAKVASLDRDAWMFEGEDVVPVEEP